MSYFHSLNKSDVGGGPFVPTNIGSLDWWMTADSLVLSDGDPVSSWHDSSSAGLHYGNATGTAQPTYKTGIINGRPVVRFITNDQLLPDPTSRQLSATNTLIIVCTPTTTSSSYIFACNQSQGVPAFISGFGGQSLEYFNTNSERASFAGSTSGFHILALTRTDNTGNARGYLDGTSVITVAADAAFDWATGAISSIGSFGGSNFFSGDIAQILHFNAILTSAQLNDVHNYLGTEYGITVATIP